MDGKEESNAGTSSSKGDESGGDSNDSKSSTQHITEQLKSPPKDSPDKSQFSASAAATVDEEKSESASDLKSEKKLKFKIQSEEIEFSVPCLYRAQCYINLLEHFLENNINSKGMIHKDINLIRNFLLMLMPTLDNLIKVFLSKELKIFRETNGISYAKLSSEKALYFLDVYFTRTIEGQMDKKNSEEKELTDKEESKLSGQTENIFGIYMQEKYPSLKNMLQQVIENHVESMRVFFARLKKDMPEIEKFFGWSSGAKLIKISGAGSDLHHKGEQVLILSFQDSKTGIKKIVYKPSPLEAHAMLTGDLKKLAAIDPKFKNQKSFFSILDPQLCYGVLPRCDVDSSDLDSPLSHYGYMEYLDSSLDIDMDYQDLAEKYLKLVEPGTRYKKIPDALLDDKEKENKENIVFWSDVEINLNKMIEEKIKKMIRKKLQSQENFSVNVKEHSQRCGKLLAMLVLLGVYDMHAENAIFCKDGIIRMIDLECCFGIGPATALATSALDGFLHTHARANERISCLFDIMGEISLEIRPVAKNRCYIKKDGKISSDSLDIEILQESYRDGMLALAKSAKKIEGWFDFVVKHPFFVRHLPWSTSDFFNARKNYITKACDSVAFRTEGKLKFKEGLVAFKTGWNNFLEALADKKIEVDMEMPLTIPIPNLVILHSIPNKNFIRQQYDSCCIPTFFVKIDQRRVYCENNVLRFPNKFYFNLKKGSHFTVRKDDAWHFLQFATCSSVQNKKDILPLTPLSYIKQRIFLLCHGHDNSFLKDVSVFSKTDKDTLEGELQLQYNDASQFSEKTLEVTDSTASDNMDKTDSSTLSRKVDEQETKKNAENRTDQKNDSEDNDEDNQPGCFCR
jgi:hypothetical protein